MWHHLLNYKHFWFRSLASCTLPVLRAVAQDPVLGGDTRLDKQPLIRDKLMKWLHGDSFNKERLLEVFSSVPS